MNLWIATTALLAGIVVWWLLVRKLTTKSWESAPLNASANISQWPAQGDDLHRSPARIGLWVFLAVVTSLFSLFMTAYYIRMGHGHGATQMVNDWRSIKKPSILWFNTALLLLASIAMQTARHAVMGGQAYRTRVGLIAGGVFTLLFLAGQLAAWQQMSASGYFIKSNPAVAFFYVLTAVHGLHLLGGLVVWARTLARMWIHHLELGAELLDIHLSVELCSIYWHYLLLVWLALFALLLYT